MALVHQLTELGNVTGFKKWDGQACPGYFLHDMAGPFFHQRRQEMGVLIESFHTDIPQGGKGR